MILSEEKNYFASGREETCAYCEQQIKADDDPTMVNIFVDSDAQIYLHRNCVVAFATRILNEFEKL